MSRGRLGASVGIVALGALCPDTHAQSMDFGGLERLFGEPVTTSATGSPQRARDVPATMEIVTAEEIRRSGAYDIPGVLRHVLGIEFQQWANDQPEISVRGYDQTYSQRVLVLIDGRQVYADFNSVTPWSALPVELESIQQIEIVKGPGSALFGFNAVSGVINIITYSPLYDDANAVSVRGGTQGLAEGSLVATLRNNNAGMRLSAGVRADEDFSTPLPPAIAGTLGRQNENRRSIDFDAAARLGDRTQAGIEVTHTQARQNDIIPNYVLANSTWSTHSLRAWLSHESALGLLSANAYTNWTEQQFYPDVPGEKFDQTNRVSVAQLQDVFKLGSRHAVRVALEYRDNSGGTTPVSGGHIFYHVLSASGMWEWQITHSLTATNAARYDDLALGRKGVIPASYPFSNSDWDRSIHHVSYNSGVVWELGDRDALRFTTGRGVLLPSLFDLGTFLAVSPFYGLTGSPTVRPSVVTNYEVSWKHSLAPLAAQFSANLFYQESTDVQAIVGGVLVTGGFPYFIPANVGNSRATGIELALDGTFREHWRWGANARLERVTDKLDPGVADVDYEHVTPRGVFNTRIGRTWGRWEADGYLHYETHASGLFPVNAGTESTLVPVPAYVAVDARLGFTVTDRITAAVSGQNLAHRSQIQTSAAAVERRVFATLVMHF
jgi:iron complex outermembrane recepter protein